MLFKQNLNGWKPFFYRCWCGAGEKKTGASQKTTCSASLIGRNSTLVFCQKEPAERFIFKLSTCPVVWHKLLAVLRSRPIFPRLRLQVKNICSGSTHKSSAPTGSGSKKTDFYTKHFKNLNFNFKKASINRDKSFLFSLAKKKEQEPAQNIGSGSRSNFKSAPAPAKRPRLGPAPQHWLLGNLKFPESCSE